jgi:hypothetical protein
MRVADLLRSNGKLKFIAEGGGNDMIMIPATRERAVEEKSRRPDTAQR